MIVLRDAVSCSDRLVQDIDSSEVDGINRTVRMTRSKSKVGRRHCCLLEGRPIVTCAAPKICFMQRRDCLIGVILDLPPGQHAEGGRPEGS